MWKAIIIVALLFPWSIVIAAFGAALYRRRLVHALRSVAEHPELYIPPSAGGPVMLDSASIAKHLRKVKQ